MTESEVLEVVNLFAGNAISSFSLWVTFTFAYLTATYLVGARLTSIQAITVSFLYLVAAGAFALSRVTHARSFEETFSAYPDFIPSDYWNLPWSILGYVMCLSGMAASFYFMYDIRKNMQKRPVRDTQ